MVDTVNISVKRGDTRRIPFHISDATGDTPISTWTDLRMVISTNIAPLDSVDVVEEIKGFIVDGPKGRLAYKPSGATKAGDYFYDASCLDANGERYTFVEGTFTITQDIGK